MPDVWCQTPECQDAAFLQSADFFQCRAAAERTFSFVTLYGRWGYSMIRSTMQHCLLSVTVQLTEWFWSECFVRWRHRAWRWSEGQKLVTKHTGCSPSFSVPKQFEPCSAVFSINISMKHYLLVVETLTCWFYKTALPLNALIGATPPAWLRIKTRSFLWRSLPVD